MVARSFMTYELRIELIDISPPLWRTFEVPAHIPLYAFHVILQVVMGWTNSHLHQFRKGRTTYALPDPDGWDSGPKPRNEARYDLDDLLIKPKQSIVYEYDFGDGWTHTITLVAIRPAAHAIPRVLAGERACPPEDCGGPHSYAELLNTIKDPRCEDHASTLQWFQSMTPEGHDPEVYPLDAINECLGHGIVELVKSFRILEDMESTPSDIEQAMTIVSFPKHRR